MDKSNQKHHVGDVFRTFIKLGVTSFGGPVAHIGYFHKELVERKRWVSEDQFSQLLAICQFLPGPSSSQLGFALGLLRAGWSGAIVAFLAFTLPSALLLFGFSSVLTSISGLAGDAVIHGLKLVAFAVVADAVWGMSKKLCPDMLRRSIALLAACTLLLMGSVCAQLLVVLVGAIIGLLFCREPSGGSRYSIKVGYGQRTGIVIFTLFTLLLAVFILVPGGQQGLYSLAAAFYRAGALVFGGGHVVLPLLEDSIVNTGWITQQSFLAGYGASQAIPGPMFAFSSYLGALIPTGYNSGLGALFALVFMFLPGFLLIAAVLPIWQSISGSDKAVNAIAGVNAAVVGVLGAALYDPIFTSGITSSNDLAIALVAFGMLAIWRLSPLYVVLWCIAASTIPLLVL